MNDVPKGDHKPPRLKDLDLELGRSIVDKETYERQLSALQIQVLRVQQAYFHQGLRGIIVFEGWDAGGKGGCIRRLTEKLDPRGFQVWPIAAPTPEEIGRHYLHRFWTRLPTPGTLAIFDRSWYGRVLVERVEGFAEESAWKRAYGEINEFERMLIDDGIRIVKLFLHISPEEQLERFTERLENPFKRWKLTADDLRNRQKRPDYEKAINAMFRKTSTERAPWHGIPANQKWYARVSVLDTIATTLGAGIDLAPPPINPEIVRGARKMLGLDM
ncbi:MAG: polyphosphate kinase [Rhodospirillaceae bacterium]|nr:polyphosphate kinase [Rhodospirillaceae bacterium]